MTCYRGGIEEGMLESGSGSGSGRVAAVHSHCDANGWPSTECAPVRLGAWLVAMVAMVANFQIGLGEGQNAGAPALVLFSLSFPLFTF